MKAIILAAGRGSRMKALTSDQPKCFTVLHGKRLIEWQMHSLQEAGIKDIAIVRGYLRESFEYAVHYFDNERWSQTNMVGSLICADNWLKQDTCVISYSDIVYSPDSVAKLMADNSPITITYDPNWLKLWSLRFDDPLSDAESFRIDSSDCLIEIGTKVSDVSHIQGQYMGLLKFTKEGWVTIANFLGTLEQKDIDRMDMTTLLRILMNSGVKIKAVKIDEPWYEVDNEIDLEKYSVPGNFKL